MWVIDLENPPSALRGLLSRWAIEVRAGLYVGNTSSKTRDSIWNVVQKEVGPDCSAVLICGSAAVQGFEVRTLGPNRREVIDVDGVWLARFLPLVPAAPSTENPDVGALDIDPAYLDEE